MHVLSIDIMDDIGHNGEELKSNRVIVVVVGLFHSLIHTHTHSRSFKYLSLNELVVVASSSSKRLMCG